MRLRSFHSHDAASSTYRAHWVLGRRKLMITERISPDRHAAENLLTSGTGHVLSYDQAQALPGRGRRLAAAGHESTEAP